MYVLQRPPFHVLGSTIRPEDGTVHWDNVGKVFLPIGSFTEFRPNSRRHAEFVVGKQRRIESTLLTAMRHAVRNFTSGEVTMFPTVPPPAGLLRPETDASVVDLSEQKRHLHFAKTAFASAAASETWTSAGEFPKTFERTTPTSLLCSVEAISFPNDIYKISCRPLTVKQFGEGSQYPKY